MKEEKIQTLHPIAGRSGKAIALHKYNAIKEEMINILSKNELTHTQLMQMLHDNLKDSFDGNVHWYSETVKLDLEARKIVERIAGKPEKYCLKKKKA